MTEGVVGCSVAQESLGALVLGAIDPIERDEIESHVRACGSCAAELAELAPLPGLLKRVDPSFFESAPAPAAILDRALGQIHAERPADLDAVGRRSRPDITWALAVTAIAVLIVGLAGARSAHVFPFAAPASVVASAVSPTTGVSATVTLHSSQIGTHVLLALNGLAPGAQCQLVAVGRDGQREVVATWVASYDGEAHVAGSTGLPADQIASFDITSPQGSTLLSLPLSL
jgi:anti-sigma factor RsiW